MSSGPGSILTEGLDESAPRAKAGFPGNELEEHDLDEAIEDEGESRQMHAIRLTPHAPDNSILGIESIEIIEQSEKTHRPTSKPPATRAVNSQVDVALGATRCEARWSLGRVQSTLGHVIREPQRWVVTSHLMADEGAAQVVGLWHGELDVQTHGRLHSSNREGRLEMRSRVGLPNEVPTKESECVSLP